MYDITTLGSLTVDLYFKGESLTQSQTEFTIALGGKYFADHFYEKLGGGATNVAIGLQRHGARASLITIIGKNSFRPMIIEKLHEHGVSYMHSKFVDDHINISCILVSKDGEKSVINFQSPHQHMFANEAEYASLLRSRNVYLSNMPDVSFFEKLKIMKYLKANKIRVFANFGVVDCRRPKEQIQQLLENVDVLIVNGHEFADLVKTDYHRIAFNKDVASFYFPNFKDRIFIITEGDKGSYGYHNGKVHHQAPIKPEKILDSTGAGDGFSAGFMGKFIKSEDIVESMKSGAEYACKILGRIGAN